ncbi:MAG: hypothetical protein LBL83_06475 [Clostridiales bacterium]|nr:hypothetical protein [Clostridiales bacterium]
MSIEISKILVFSFFFSFLRFLRQIGCGKSAAANCLRQIGKSGISPRGREAPRPRRHFGQHFGILPRLSFLAQAGIMVQTASGISKL